MNASGHAVSYLNGFDQCPDHGRPAFGRAVLSFVVLVCSLSWITVGRVDAASIYSACKIDWTAFRAFSAGPIGGTTKVKCYTSYLGATLPDIGVVAWTYASLWHGGQRVKEASATGGGGATADYVLPVSNNRWTYRAYFEVQLILSNRKLLAAKKKGCTIIARGPLTYTVACKHAGRLPPKLAAISENESVTLEFSAPEGCGDGVVKPGAEQCDDGNQTNGDQCENDCTLPRCGNGIVDVGEGCDGACGTGLICDRCTSCKPVYDCTVQCCDGTGTTIHTADASSCIAYIGPTPALCDRASDGLVHGGLKSITFNGSPVVSHSCDRCCAKCGNRADYHDVAVVRDCTVEAREYCSVRDRGPFEDAVWGYCPSTCGDGVKSSDERCDGGTCGDGQPCQSNCTCPPPVFPCDVQCCDGRTWQNLKAHNAAECAGFGGGALCNGGGSWANVYFNGTHVAAGSCGASCGLECCSWSISQAVGGIFNVRDRAACINAGAFKCAHAGSGVRNLLYGSVAGGPLTDWITRTACPSTP